MNLLRRLKSDFSQLALSYKSGKELATWEKKHRHRADRANPYCGSGKGVYRYNALLQGEEMCMGESNGSTENYLYVRWWGIQHDLRRESSQRAWVWRCWNHRLGIFATSGINEAGQRGSCNKVINVGMEVTKHGFCISGCRTIQRSEEEMYILVFTWRYGRNHSGNAKTPANKTKRMKRLSYEVGVKVSPVIEEKR